MATNGPEKIGRINVVDVLTRVFLQENVWRFLPGGQKKVAVRRGSTLLSLLCFFVVYTEVFVT